MAVFATVDPDKDENTVPPTTDTTDRRPGSRAIRVSMASMALSATPVWNRISPISTNSGIGARMKLDKDAMALRANWLKPASPPRKTMAPMMLTPKKAKATGSPRAISVHKTPSIRTSAQTQSTAQTPCRGRSVAAVPPNRRRRNSIASSSIEAGSTASSHHSATINFLEDQRADAIGVERRGEAVVQEGEGDREAGCVHGQFHRSRDPRRNRRDQQVDADMGGLVQHPGGGQKGGDEQRVFDHLDHPRKISEPEVANQHVGADHHRHRGKDQAGAGSASVEKLRVTVAHGRHPSTAISPPP